MSNNIKIYSFPLSGHAHRVELFVGLANIPHHVVNLDLAAGEHKQDDYLALNPAGQVPTIVDGETVISDSNAILVYLARKYAPQFLPTEHELEAEVQKFLTLAAGELAFGPAAARLITVFNAPLDPDHCQTVATRLFNKLEQHLENKVFLVAEKLTIADVALYSYSAHAPEGNVSLHQYTNVRRWLKTIEMQPGFKAMPTTQVGLLAS
ncbi:glutathione S-transferase family protein [Endozoicomonas sp. G2_1]|uniref:glutathione S-transferase family protein n=1 Tax=Endozoicomonas sp. G2_1 TaxID=2821091 RepID=UPI001ADD50D0|nr:glutathione S-transferase [Endozoicomonas sp. G2_1]MBO9490598.1 glutathione S-transferase family protein [Endozoicomonas sp. G2_1]